MGRSLPTDKTAPSGGEYFYQVTHPLPTDHTIPSCSLLLLHHDFADTYGFPPVSVDYAPPVDCPGEWAAVVLEFNASCRGEQYDRIAAVWIDGVELLRTSTAEPTGDGIFWSVRKDVTRYASVLRRSDATLAVMLENIVNEVFTGVYHVNISAYYYDGGNEREKTEGFDSRNGYLGVGIETLGQEYASADRRKGLIPLPSWAKPAWLRKLDFTSRKKEDKDRKTGFLLNDEDAVDRTELGTLLRKKVKKAGNLEFVSDKVDLEFPEDQASFSLNVGWKVRSGSEGQRQAAVSSNLLSNKPADKILPISSNATMDSGSASKTRQVYTQRVLKFP